MNISSLQQAVAQPIERTPGIGPGKALDQAGQDFQALSASLSSGDLSSAQGSFNDLKKLLASFGSIGAANSVKSDFDALGKALGSGDVSAARNDLDQLKTAVQTALHPSHAPGHPTRPGGGSNYQQGLSAIKSILHFVT